jgi:LCP family protein required for cell wall assembly
MKNFFEKIKSTFPRSTKTRIILGVLLGVGLLGGILLGRFVSNFVAEMTILNLPGEPVSAAAEPVDGGTGTEVVTSDGTPTLDAPQAPLSAPVWDGKTRVNVLIMGIDARSPDVRAPLTDTMILFTIDPVSNTAGMISIPRDLWVKIPGSEYGKINTAYSIGESFQLPGGGPGLAVRTVEDLLGVPIQYYAQINFEAFVSFIDNIDGVKVTIPERIQLDIVNTDRSYWLDPGTYTLPGDLALAYVRNRSTSGGDFDRAQRQQQVIMAIRDRVLSFNMMPTLIAKAPQLYADLSSGIRTNLTLDQALSLAQKALSIPRDQILSRAINGSYVNFGTSPDGLSMLRPIPDKVRELRDEVFGGVSAVNAEQNLETILQEEGASISVRNASSQEGLAAKTAEYLRAKGLNVVEETNAAYQTYSTITFYGAKPYTLHYLVDLFKISPSTRIVYAYDPAATVDLVLYLGDDFAANSTLP